MRPRVVVLALTSIVSASAYVQNWNSSIDPSEALRRLERRADTCPSDRPKSCSSVDPKLPSNWCCPSSDTCVPIDRSKGAICCPPGSDCASIFTIECDTSLQDPDKNVGAPIFTTRLNDKLETCGDKCCPFGYTCNKDDNGFACVLKKEDAGPATTSKVTSTATATATSAPNTTTSSQALNSNDPPPKKESSFPPGVFFAGFVPGILVGVLATLAWVVYTKRNNKPIDTRGLNVQGHGARPFISAPVQDVRSSNGRSDFLGRSRSRARSMFSSNRHTRTVDTSDIMAAKMPTPPPHGPIPVNYINDMPDVPVTPARRVARYHSDEYIPRAETDYEKREISPVSANVSDPHTHETIRIYSPEIVQQQNAAPVMPQAPLASIPPLRGMNTQRRASPDYDTAAPSQQRRDSGTGMGTFGSPFQTPEKKPTIVNRHTPSMYATYHDASTLHSPEDQQPIPQTLTPARYDPKANLAPSAAATLASSRLSKAHQGLPSQQQSKPTIPARPEARQQMRPETQYSEFNFDHGLDHDDEPESPIGSPPREAYKSQAVSNPYAQPRANPTSTFDSMIPAAPSSQFDKSKQDKHATNATTFTTMLKNVGFPDPGDQLGKGVPKVPKLDMSKVNGKQGKKGMI